MKLCNKNIKVNFIVENYVSIQHNRDNNVIRRCIIHKITFNYVWMIMKKKLIIKVLNFKHQTTTSIL